MPQKILNEEWNDYDDKKIRDRRDAKDFACSEIWEVDYLVRKIRKVYPDYSEWSIRNVIAGCCVSVGSPHPRDKFVACVMKKLRES